MDVLSSIKSLVVEDLKAFDALLEEMLSSDSALFEKVKNHFFASKGKQIRPALTLLAAHSCGQITDSTTYAAVGLELLHTASLLHDDVVDGSNLRRSRQSVNALWGDKTAILSGDFLLSTSLLAISKTSSLPLFELFARLGRSLSEGELIQLENVGKVMMDEKSYFEVINKKTARLFTACCVAGAMTGGGSAEQINVFSQVGRLLGLCFQLQDDLFDYESSVDSIGKPVALDIAERKFTLPLIAAIENASKNSSDQLTAVFKAGSFPDDPSQVIDFVIRHKGIDYTKKTMERLKNEGLQHIKSLPSSPSLEAIEMCLKWSVSRKS